MTQSLNEEYHDRGMMKWGGFILAEHQALQETTATQKNQHYPQKPQQTLAEIHAILQRAQVKNQGVAIQREALDEDYHYYPDVVGKIMGFDELGIYIGATKIDYDEIRHVEIQPFQKWYQP